MLKLIISIMCIIFVAPVVAQDISPRCKAILAQQAKEAEDYCKASSKTEKEYNRCSNVAVRILVQEIGKCESGRGRE
jgi:hypothetical protein